MLKNLWAGRKKKREESIKEYKDALKADQPYNLAILDLAVKGAMGGQETAAHILKTDPTAQLIVSSGYAEDPVLANHKQYGFADILSKPYTKIAFLEAIGRIVVKQYHLNLACQVAKTPNMRKCF